MHAQNRLRSFLPNMTQLRREGESTETYELTPAECASVMKNWEYHRQRNVRSSRVTTYLRQMQSGDWTYRTEMHVGVLSNETCYLLNGYHRLTAAAQVDTSGFTFPVRFIFRLSKDDRDLADYYSVMDIGGTRSTRDSINAQGIAEEWG